MTPSIENLIQRCASGIASLEEQQVVTRWRAADARNEALYQELLSALNMASAANVATDVGQPPEAQKLVWLAEARQSGEQLGNTRRGARMSRWVLLAAAAGVVFALLLPSIRQPSEGEFSFDVETFIAGATEPVTVRLTDGSLVRLAPKSRLRLLNDPGSRAVEFDGRGFFAVSRDADRPFRVVTRAGEVRVMGTRFQLETEDVDLRVVVIDGRVALVGVGDQVEVTAGEIGKMVNGVAGPAAGVAKLAPMVDWVGNFFAFQDTPLRSALEEISRRFNLQYEVTDSALAERTITMWFVDRSPAEMMRVICTVVNASCEVGTDRILVAPDVP